MRPKTGANFVLRDHDGDDLRALLAPAAYAVGVDGGAVMDALKPGSWVLLKQQRTGAGAAPSAAAGPAYVPLGRATAAVAAAAAAAAAQAQARTHADAVATAALIGDHL